MPKSMTGYGKATRQENRWSLTWELRSVNSRHLDLKWRLPMYLRNMETTWERVIREYAQRGRLELSLHARLLAPELAGMTLNKGMASSMLSQIESLANDMGRHWEADFSRLLTMQQLWEDEGSDPDPELTADAEKALREALEDWNQARAQEGHALAEDLLARLETMRGLLAAVEERLPILREEKIAAIENRIQATLERYAIEMDRDRLLQEVAVISDRLEVSEEMTRLKTHLERLAEILEQGGEAGKRLDFTLQECFREINTLGNKSQDAKTSQLVVDFKAELEKCREQVQNLE